MRLELIVAFGLALWRLSSLLYDEVGPWEACIWLRERLGIEHDEDGHPAIYPGWAQPFHCFWCLTLLLAAPCAALVFVVQYEHHSVLRTLLTFLVNWGAIATVGVVVERWIGRSKARLF